ncbi:MAG: hypothetical protein R2794_05945 [Chitinophagales bacterium]
MVKQFRLPLYVIWIFAGIAFVVVGCISIIHWTYGVGTFLLCAAVAYIGFRLFFRPALIALEIIKSGEPAMAVILDVWDTGSTVNHNPRVGLLLEIRHSSMVPYEVEVKHNVSKEKLEQLRKGHTLQVKVDARDPKKVAILGI